MMKLSRSQLYTLQCARNLEENERAAIFPRRGQHRGFNILVRLGLLRVEGPGVDIDDHMHEVKLYRLTDAGRGFTTDRGGL
jgi:hypothetical protein